MMMTVFFLSTALAGAGAPLPALASIPNDATTGVVALSVAPASQVVSAREPDETPASSEPAGETSPAAAQEDGLGAPELVPEPAPIRPAADILQPDTPERSVNEEVARVEAYLSAIDTLQARFVQTGPNGAPLSGGLWLDRPGRVRFEYDDPSPILIVADGSTIAIEDRALETVDRAPIRATPLRWLLDRTPDLAGSGAVVDAARYDGFLYLTLEDPDGEAEGRLTLIFEDREPGRPASAMALSGWYAVDAMGGLTQLRLDEVALGGAFDPRLFILDDPQDRRGRARRR